MKQKKSYTILLIMTVILIALSHKAGAQCKYVSIDNGKADFISIPCDFPVQMNTGNPATDKENFDKAVAEWKKQHPEASRLDMKPALVSGNFIQIPGRELVSFPIEKQEAIREKSGFYQIIQ